MTSSETRARPIEQRVGKIVVSHAVIISAGVAAHRAERKAAVVLREEIAKRSGLDWPIRETPEPDRPAVIFAHADRAPAGLAIPPEAMAPTDSSEGYTIYLEVSDAPRIWLVGGCGRAALFAAGWLLRRLEIEEGSVVLPAQESGRLISTQPRYPIRGHQICYRNVLGPDDAWGEAEFEQYFRDIVIFGANSIELSPPQTPHEQADEAAPQTPWEMLAPWELNRRLSALLDSYDLDVWIHLPTTGDWDSKHPTDWEAMLGNRDRLFHSMVRLDHVLVPGGDPGEMPPDLLFPFLEELVPVLHRNHPNAGLWVSPQGFKNKNGTLARFIDYLQTKQPDWLTGVVYGPWVHDSLPHIREVVPSKYKLRRYPDITHSCRCQYPVPEWDSAFAFTLGRETINPRPLAEAHIHNRFMECADGTVAYIEGVHDDVNKAIWSARLWNPDQPVHEILVEYGRTFIGHELSEAVADGLLALEENWRGPLLGNPRHRQTLAQWREIWRKAGEKSQVNWRLQQGYFRALYDVYVQSRLDLDTQQEKAALEILAKARDLGAEEAAKQAIEVLRRSTATPDIETMRQEILHLGELLYKTIQMQMSVPLYHAPDEERGAVLDFLGIPLNDRVWILNRIQESMALPTKVDRIAALKKIAHWTDPGPGGFYDDLGNPGREPHLVRGEGWEQDPGFLRTALDEFGGDSPNYRYSWNRQATTLYATPLQMHYTGLDRSARYRLKVVYNGRFHAMMRLEANGQYEVHGPIRGTLPPSVMEFLLPQELTQEGKLSLKWVKVEGRGCQVAEVWLEPTDK